MSNDEDAILMNETNFLLSLEVINRQKNKTVGDIIGNLTELNKYIEPTLIIENRNVNHNISNEVKIGNEE